MLQVFYRIIYQPQINFFLRNINRSLLSILPKNVKIPPSGICSIKLQNRKKIYLKTNQTSYLTQLVFWNGYQNFEYTGIFLQLIKKVSCFYDIGANIGYYSLLAAAQNPNIKVYGFEPALGPLHFLKENVKLNAFQNINVMDVALSDKEQGVLEFYEVQNKKYKYLKHNLAGEGNAGSKTSGRNFVKNTVKTTTLDAFWKQAEMKGPDLIKIDTEGTEHYILQNGSRVLSEQQPIVICETLFNTIEAELEEIMLGHGYGLYDHVPGGLLQVPSIVRKRDNGVSNCFFVHPSKKHLIEPFLIHQKNETTSVHDKH